jgi:hypothetical protein
MEQHPSARRALLAGPLYFVTTMTAIFISPLPDLGAGSTEMRTWLSTTTESRQAIASTVGVLSLVALMVFAAALLQWATATAAGLQWLRGVAATAVGVAVAAHLIAFAVPSALVLHAQAGLDITTASTLNDLGMVLHWGGEAAYAVFLGCVGIAGVSGRTLPRWLAWSAAVIAVSVLCSLPFATHGWVHIPATLGGLWTVVAGIILVRPPTAGRSGPGAASTP